MSTIKLKIGIVGCGAIGTSLAVLIDKRLSNSKVVSLCDVDEANAQALKKKLGYGLVGSLKQVVKACDLVVEAASAKCSFEIAKQALLCRKDVLIMSIGGILGREKKLFEIARKNKIRIYFPSGAICGLDGLKALIPAGIERITLRTMKPPRALEGADYIVKNKIDLSRIKTDKVIFRGAAYEAVKAFPQNINVVALLSIAACGLVVPRVEIIASPGQKRNIHIIEIRSKAARLLIRCENVPSPDNPKTSYLAVLSALATIVGINDRVRIGT
ncbi:MAG: aspartate dehydrogenase domain-containing protein [Candidatus Omnitrophota bacterium]